MYLVYDLAEHVYGQVKQSERSSRGLLFLFAFGSRMSCVARWQCARRTRDRIACRRRL